jgi:cytochrome c-type biogenesis protein CcmH
MDSVVARLEARLAASGGSDGDWELLAKSYEFLNRADAAALARQHRLGAAAGESATAATQVIDQPTIVAAPLSTAALKLVAAANAARSKRDYIAARNTYRQLAGMQQMNADTWADYADVVASLNANSLAGEPEKYLQQALRIDPRHAKALWLQASMEHETGRHAAAVSTWQRLAALMDPASSDAKLIAANIREDQQLAGGATAAGISVRGDVTLEQSLRSRVVAGTTLFILAKSVNSPGAPVAVIRTATAGWPVQFELNDTQAMIPDRKLSTAGMVTIEARISQSGQALPQPGDLLGSSAALDPAEGKPVHIVIQKPVG